MYLNDMQVLALTVGDLCLTFSLELKLTSQETTNKRIDNDYWIVHELDLVWMVVVFATDRSFVRFFPLSLVVRVGVPPCFRLHILDIFHFLS